MAWPGRHRLCQGIPCHAGTHVNFALNRVRDVIADALGKHQGCSASVLRGHLTLLVNVSAVNPTFTLPAGCRPTPSEDPC